MRLGLYGGSFDPVHAGHLSLAETARQQLQLDELWWIPAGRPWQKGAQWLSPQHRLRLLEAVLAGRSGHRIEPCEIERSAQGQRPSYSIDTVTELADRLGPDWVSDQVWLVIGQDQLARLPSWHRWSDLLARVGLAVAGRDQQAAQAPPEVEQVLRRLGRPLVRLEMPGCAASSTELRRLLQHGADANELLKAGLPPAALGYIERHRITDY
jgi:nicotinate-nucleotide adenylyltransferase